MYKFLHERNLIYKYQSGFQSGHSTIYQIIEIYDNICKVLDEKEYMCMVFCAISKAFDRVWFGGLIHKCKGYGLKIIFLTGYIVIYMTGSNGLYNTNSAFLPVKAGVPVGSVLGPLLFYSILTIFLIIYVVLHDCLQMTALYLLLHLIFKQLKIILTQI